MRAFLLLLTACAAAPSTPSSPQPKPPPPVPAKVPSIPDELEGTVDQIRKDALAIEPWIETPLARQFLAKTAELPHIEPRTIYKSADKKRWSREPGPDLTAVKVDEPLYYETKYGSPLAYTRPLDILGHHGVRPTPGVRSADFGYGGVAPLRLLASIGWNVTGIDVDPMLPVLYLPADSGAVGKNGGSVRMLDGRFPVDPAITQAVGSGLGLFLSKNTLKRGYIHPYRAADPTKTIDLGGDEPFLKAVHDALLPGGWFLVYNICPALTPEDKPFVPWSDGRSPFSREQLAAAGFEVLEFDRDDTDAIRLLGHVLRWDQGADAMDLIHDLSVLYTLARRR
jgi:hypothetical protein